MNIVITGAARGLGKAIASAFAADGHRLFLCSRNEAALFNTAHALITAFPQATINARAANLAVKEEVEAFAKWISEQASHADILVNNAGSFVPGSVHNEPEGALEEMLQINLFSAYHLTRALLPVMMKRKTGHIFNMCSIASLQAYANGGAYSISKFALLGFSKNLREELKPHGIKVTAVMPGAVYTDSWAGSGVDPKRIMEAGDIARLVHTAAGLSLQACVEDIIIRPQPGDL